MSTFIITGMGRSGTQFLSNTMNTSLQWEVLHEPRGNKDHKAANKKRYLQQTLNPYFAKRQNYGEVNGYLRYYISGLNVEKKGILLRNTRNIFLSMMNRKNYLSIYKSVGAELLSFYDKFYNVLNTNKEIISIVFEEMTTNVQYLDKIIKEFGINDVIVDQTTIEKKINVNVNIKFKTYADLPIKVQKYAEVLRKYEDHSMFIK